MIIHEMEQQTPEWFAIRSGKPTSSEFKRLVTPKGKASSMAENWGKELAGEKYLGRSLSSFEGNVHTERGNELEPEALAYYEERTGNVVTPVGFITDDLMRYGSSTDGLTEEGDKKGAVEAKCLSNKNHLFLLLEYLKSKEKALIPDDYKPQVQGEILVGELDWVDLLFYHPDFDSVIVRQYPDEKFQALLKSQLTVCLKSLNESYKILTGE